MGEASIVTARRKARTVVLQALYEVDCVGHPWDEVTERHLNSRRLSPGAVPFVRDLVKGVMADTERIDGIIARFAPAWPVSQMAVIDRNLLRMAIYELVLERTAPPKVVINETVELAKRFSSESSFRLVNGVLGSVLEMAGT
ncbi:MAG: transcription antitermination factor NusB [Chloroflexi bacterium]|nr:transcription antitermination factor NusB [Chloroflexota bacterium]